MALIEEKSGIDLLAWLVAAVAAINWGVQAIVGNGIFVEYLGLSGETLSTVYIVIGVLGVVNLLSWFTYALDDAMGGM